jgi:hypothetical protein
MPMIVSAQIRALDARIRKQSTLLLAVLTTLAKARNSLIHEIARNFVNVSMRIEKRERISEKEYERMRR